MTEAPPRCGGASTGPQRNGAEGPLPRRVALYQSPTHCGQHAAPAGSPTSKRQDACKAHPKSMIFRERPPQLGSFFSDFRQMRRADSRGLASASTDDLG
ncbi:hypothetical protein E1H18_761 [Caulobacter sp. RHG1]|nr:hypothetical protein [Caulobacter sp. RHG1]